MLRDVSQCGILSFFFFSFFRERYANVSITMPAKLTVEYRLFYGQLIEVAFEYSSGTSQLNSHYSVLCQTDILLQNFSFSFLCRLPIHFFFDKNYQNAHQIFILFNTSIH